VHRPTAGWSILCVVELGVFGKTAFSGPSLHVAANQRMHYKCVSGQEVNRLTKAKNLPTLNSRLSCGLPSTFGPVPSVQRAGSTCLSRHRLNLVAFCSPFRAVPYICLVALAPRICLQARIVTI
jgi:hypothetical protein